MMRFQRGLANAANLNCFVNTCFFALINIAAFVIDFNVLKENLDSVGQHDINLSNVIKYVDEWTTHPMTGNRSDVDDIKYNKFANDLRTACTCLMQNTPDDIEHHSMECPAEFRAILIEHMATALTRIGKTSCMDSDVTQKTIHCKDAFVPDVKVAANRRRETRNTDSNGMNLSGRNMITNVEALVVLSVATSQPQRIIILDIA